ncbi:MAG: MgtC/SapB family protein [Bdellovibrionales bacterium]|nr:MgtC/SapB family protein [Bdellovibrionales bacterium]
MSDISISLIHFEEIERLALAAGLGALLGLERELAGKDPSLRTFALICAGSCLFTIVSTYAPEGNQYADPARISAQIVSGIGFLGAGAIFRSRVGVQGLTTAALMWLAAAIGMAVGMGHAQLAFEGTLVGLAVMLILKFVHRIIRYLRPNFYDDKALDFD